MGIEMLQSYIETNYQSAFVPVDLFKIARNMAHVGHNLRPPITTYRVPFEHPEYFYTTPLCLVIDGETCLDRLYGGFFGDWVCGGQWNRMVEFLSNFFYMLSRNNMEVTVFFNGALEMHRMEQWIEKQKTDKEKITQVLRHVAVKGTPPPKVWWVPPSCLRSCLQLVLRNLNVNTVVTFTDHHQEVMSYVRDHRFHGLIAADSEYLCFEPPMYFNAELLKLTFKGCLETKEYVLNEVTRCLNLHPSRLCILATLLGNHILSDSDLVIFHHSLCPDVKGKVPLNTLIKAVVDFIRNIPSVDDLDDVSKLVFGPNNPEKCLRFKRSVHYYSKGNKQAVGFNSSSSGYPQSSGSNSHQVFENNHPEAYEFASVQSKTRPPLLPNPTSSSDLCDSTNSSTQEQDNYEDLENSSKFASETAESELSSLEAYRQVLGKNENPTLYQKLPHLDDDAILDCGVYANNSGDNCVNLPECTEFQQTPTVDAPTTIGACGGSLEATVAAINLNCKAKKNKKNFTKHVETPPLPKVSMDVMQLARDRHGKGLMNSHIFQILSQGEIKIPTTFEDEITGDLPCPSILYRPLRQMVYGILFNHHHLSFLAGKKDRAKNEEEIFHEIIIKEWVWNKSNKYNKPDLVPSLPLGWSVPTVTRLWFGKGPEYNKKRLQAFLTCMRSNSRLMHNTNYVPQPYIILCCILRYMMTHPDGCVLRKQELDAFLVQAVNPHLTNVTETQKLELPLITPRGVQLGALFMQGVENAMIANDACGAPIPWLMCSPWLFFDGKIFHRMLLKANGAKNLVELCDNRIEEVAKVERMRNAVLEELHIPFAIPGAGAHRSAPHLPFPNFPMPVPGMAGRGRGHQRVVPRGGQLEVAGVVVGSWGPNYGQGPRSPNRSIPPQVVSVGGASRGRANNLIGIGHGQPHRLGTMPNKPNIPGTKIKPRDGIKANTDPMRMFRTIGRGCTLEINKQNMNYTPVNQHHPSNDHESGNCWEGSFANEKNL